MKTIRGTCNLIEDNNIISNVHCNINLNLDTEGTCKSKELAYVGKCIERNILLSDIQKSSYQADLKKVSY